jgi:hypothetical protein
MPIICKLSLTLFLPHIELVSVFMTLRRQETFVRASHVMFVLFHIYVTNASPTAASNCNENLSLSLLHQFVTELFSTTALNFGGEAVHSLFRGNVASLVA